jgi:hypothetical protein
MSRRAPNGDWRSRNRHGRMARCAQPDAAHWRDSEQREWQRFFFCQLEAIETVIWLTEARRCGASRHRDSRRRWRVYSNLHDQNGDQFGQDHRNVNAMSMRTS